MPAKKIDYGRIIAKECKRCKVEDGIRNVSSVQPIYALSKSVVSVSQLVMLQNYVLADTGDTVNMWIALKRLYDYHIPDPAKYSLKV